MLDVNTVVMLVLMTAVAVINMISALLIMILERTAMIGIFKAMGAGNWVIQKIFLYNAAYLIGVGLLLGNLLGLG
jgi:lipoprotein-releasing system permease protein